MPDLVITATAVVADASAKRRTALTGAAVTAGQIVHISPTTGRFILSDADAAGISDVRKFYVALNSAAANQTLTAMESGLLTINAVLTRGVQYFLSPNPGGIAPRADLLTGDNVVYLGTAVSTTVLSYEPHIPGVTL